MKAFVGGVTAAASGAIAGPCYVLARRAMIALIALGIVWRFKVPEPVLIAAGGLAGFLIFWARG